MPDLLAIVLALLAGLVVRAVHLPPLVGFLAAGFLLHALGGTRTPLLTEFAELGITLLLFTIGLKLRPASLLMPQIWGVGALHMILVTALGSGFLFLLAMAGFGRIAGLSTEAVVLLGFALSFSSTVFAIKALEEQGETSSLYARIAIGVLIVQDLAAVLYLAASGGKLPSVWALGLLLLIPMRPVLHRVLAWSGRGELQVLFGLTIALGGAWICEQLGVKGDLGALLLGALLAGSPRTADLARQLTAFKDLFLVGFFMGIGLSAPLSLESLGLAALVLLLVPVKTLLFFLLFLRFHLRARTAFMAALALANISEFGLIVLSIGARDGVIGSEWMVVMALALSMSFIIAAPLNAHAHAFYSRWRGWLHRWERPGRIPEEADIDPGDVQIIVFGMGRVGTGAYDAMRNRFGRAVLGVDVDERKVARHQAEGRHVIRGSATDPDFRERVHLDLRRISVIMLALPSAEEMRIATQLLRQAGYRGRITATAHYEEEEGLLRDAGVDEVYNFYAEAGTGFADTVCARLLCDLPEQEQGKT
ncbi:MAG: potassium transporter Kef [Gammaproteobacteria bacterium]|nr:MAG: potassium transporter Kef [Gammaproteobacteria bacterium]